MSDRPSHFARVEALFDRVSGLAPEQREDELARHAAEDPEVAAEVRRMLTADAAIGERLERPAEPPRAAPLDPEVEGYRVLRRLGSGGMGVVYEGEQETPRRRVALKLIRPGLLSEGLIRRFMLESEALARLQHPGIAQIFEAGTTRDGAPFFAMEYVEGEPLVRYAESHGLNRRARLELFASICDAVHHAHQKGVVHRDLKPSNILVTADGRPKILDFGVARLADSDVRAATVATEAGQLVGTLAYMSPEQATGQADRIDTRSDVFTLGVVLYQLLSGKLPLDMDGVSILEAIHRVREVAPPRLGTFDTRFRGDVETIVGRALAKEPERRYSSAAELAEDIRRHLTDQPINARPPTTVYHLRKFARRNRALVGVTVLACALVVAALVVVSVSLREALDQRRRADAQQALAVEQAGLAEDRRVEAERQSALAAEQARLAEERRAEAERMAAITTEVSRFMHQDLIGALAPGNGGADVTVRQVVDTAAEVVDDSFADRPEIAGAVHTSLGNIYNAVGEYASSERELLRGVAGLESSLGPDHELSIFAREDLASLYDSMGRLGEAREHIAVAVLRAEAVFGPGDERTLRALLTRGRIERSVGAFDASAATLELVRSRAEAALPPDHPILLDVRNGLASHYFETNRFEQAEPLYRGVLEQRAATLGEQHPLTLVAMNNLAAALEGLGRNDEALELYRAIVALEGVVLGENHPDTLPTRHNLGFLLAAMGRTDEAEPVLRDVLETCAEVLGPGHPGTLTCTRTLANLLVETGRFAEAEPVLMDAIERATAGLGAEHPLTGSLEFGLASALRGMGRPGEAAARFERVARLLEPVYGPADDTVLNASLGAARSYLDSGAAERAEPIARAALDASAGTRGHDDPLTRGLAGVLADSCEGLGRGDEAAAIRREYALP